MIFDLNTNNPVLRTMVTDGVLAITGEVPPLKGPFGREWKFVSNGDLNVQFPEGEYNPFVFFNITARGKVKLLNKAPGPVYISAPEIEFPTSAYPDVYARDERENSLISWDHDLPYRYPNQLTTEDKFDLLMEHLGLQVQGPNDPHTSEGQTTVALRWRIVKRDLA